MAGDQSTQMTLPFKQERIKPGDKFGDWAVLRQGRGRGWICQCRCGSVRTVQDSKLTSGRWKTCGCGNVKHGCFRNTLAEVRPGDTIGGLLLIEKVNRKGRGGRAIWLCVCECGSDAEMPEEMLKLGAKTSCGCKRQPFNMRSLRRTYRSMVNRCCNQADQAYKDYGGRGIKICDRWLSSFDSFVTDVGIPLQLGLSLDRINNDGDYEPGNVRWADAVTQRRNSRYITPLTVNGETLLMQDWARRLGCYSTVIYNRIRRGWSISDAVTAPVAKRGRPKAAECRATNFKEVLADANAAQRSA